MIPVFEMKDIRKQLDEDKEEVSITEIERQMEDDHREEALQSRVTSTVIILLFLAHPSITTSLFTFIKCKEMDYEYRMYEDLQVTCYNPLYNTVFYMVIIPGILLWIIGIPLYGLYSLREI
jgi:hypothetical protein